MQANIIDPHGQHLADSLPKLLGLADYAEKYCSSFQTIKAITSSGDTYRSLDLKNSVVRDAIRTAPSAKFLFEGENAQDYD